MSAAYETMPAAFAGIPGPHKDGVLGERDLLRRMACQRAKRPQLREATGGATAIGAGFVVAA
ncbi:hypothetical protein GCM10010289_49770 [Streptomyces violascens]|uniref:Uncharacterized protein n=1 Tax=Streptomyces violascens TaxID=67381 RepID=A0ABQ3QYL6_9ACTN|nr:hypothetical protein GCM10010289_49770 [Streptomyces violascens]GHI42358.1 hypothetical protein Sviol_67660 [Streptomyces violascens]